VMEGLTFWSENLMASSRSSCLEHACLLKFVLVAVPVSEARVDAWKGILGRIVPHAQQVFSASAEV